MAKTFKIKVDYVPGESQQRTFKRIQLAIEEAKEKNGVTNAIARPNISEAEQNLSRNQRPIFIDIIETRSASWRTARRYKPSPAIEIADAQGALDLEAAARKITPELTPFEISQIAGTLGARKVALETALYGRPGLSRDLRISHIGGSESDDSLASKIIGYEPNRAAKIDAAAAAHLKNQIKKTMLDIGVEEGNARVNQVKEVIESSFRSKYRLLDEDILNRFTMMLKAHHEIREMNKSYMMAMMTGMQGAEFPDILLSMLAPSPDDFLQGTDAMVIIDTKVRPNVEGGGWSDMFSQFILTVWNNILNTGKRRKPVKVTEIQRSVAALLEHYEYDRKKMVKEIEQACREARRKGGDFLEAFTAYPYAADAEADVQAEEIRDLVIQAAQVADDEDPTFQLQIPDEDENALKLFKELADRGMAVRIGNSEYFIVPMSMPRFQTPPIGWDRRWMVSTMRVVDEYWELIFSDQGISLHDLLYLIATRTQELFDYAMDAEDLLLLAVLLVGNAEEMPEDEEEEGEGEEDEGEEEEDEEEEEEEEMEEAVPEGDAEVAAQQQLREMFAREGAQAAGEEEERRARRKGILPTVRGRERPLKTIGGLIGIGDATSKLRSRVAELEDQREQILRVLQVTARRLQAEADTARAALDISYDRVNQLSRELMEAQRTTSYNIAMLKELFKKYDVGDLDSVMEIAQKGEQGLQDAWAITKKNRDIFKRARDMYKKRLSPAQKKKLIDDYEKQLRAEADKLTDLQKQFKKAAKDAEIEAENKMKEQLDKYGAQGVELQQERKKALDLTIDLQALEERLEEELQKARQQSATAARDQGLFLQVPFIDDEDVKQQMKKVPKKVLQWQAANIWKIPTEGRTVNQLVDDIFEAQNKFHDGETVPKETLPIDSRRARRKSAKPIADIHITRADGTGTELGLVTAEVMIGVNIVSDIKTGVRDLFGGRAKSGEVKLQNAMNILVAELKSRAADMGATHITNFHAEPFAYGSYGSIIAIYGFGVARKGGKKKAKSNPPMYFDADENDSDVYVVSNAFLSQILNSSDVLKTLESRFKKGANLDLLFEDALSAAYQRQIIAERTGKGVEKAFSDAQKVEDAIVLAHATYQRGITKKPYLKSTPAEIIDEAQLDAKVAQGVRVASSKPKKTYKGMEITGKKGAWEVEAYGRTFKTLQQARDFITKKAKGSAKPNQRCPMVFKGKQCTGIVVAITPKTNPHNTWKCKECNHKFREA